MCYSVHLWLLIFCIHGNYASKLHPRVYDGQELRPHVHKYLVQLRTYCMNYVNLPYTLCSGSIINQRWIISAAHCFRDYTSYVEVEKPYKILGYVYKSQIILYPGFIYNNLSFEKDLALLKTSEDIQFDMFTGPIKLSTISPKFGQAVVITGYGAAETGAFLPREGHTRVAECLNPNTTLICTKSTVRAGPGDSGGALVSKGRLVGVTSATCDEVEKYQICESIYVDVTLHLDWIKEIMLNRTVIKMPWIKLWKL